MEQLKDMFTLGGRRGSEGRDMPPAPLAPQWQGRPTQETDSFVDEYSMLSRDTVQQEEGMVPPPPPPGKF